MSRAAFRSLLLILMAVQGALLIALFTYACDAGAGNVRKQRIRLPETCYAAVASDDPEGPDTRVYVASNERYQLIAHLAGVTKVLADLPCSDLEREPRVVEINGTYPLGMVCGRTVRFPDGCVPVRVP